MDNLQQMVAEIQIEQAELGELPNDGWDNYPWVDQVRFEISDEDVDEAIEMFESDCQHQADFEEWLMDLTDHDFVAMTRAIDEIRRVMKTAWKPLPFPVLQGWIDLD